MTHPSSEVMARLAAGATVLVPTQRLARDLKRRFDRDQMLGGLLAWDAADVLPYGNWLERSYDEMHSWEVRRLLLSPRQESALWRDIIGRSPHVQDLNDLDALARLAQEAWAAQHGWNIPPHAISIPASPDVQAYRAWSAEFARVCDRRGWLSRAQLAEVVRSGLEAATAEVRPDDLVLYAFDVPTPAQARMIETCRRLGARIDVLQPVSSHVRAAHRVYATSSEELTATAWEIRAILLANPEARVALVAPDLAARRSRIERVLDEVLEPARLLDTNPGLSQIYNFSLGTSLSSHPIARAAIAILRLAFGKLSLPEFGEMLLGPFVGSAQTTQGDRSILDVRLREAGGLEVTTERLSDMLVRIQRDRPSGSQWIRGFLDWIPKARASRSKRMALGEWSEVILELLAAIGWPGERPLNSSEYQVAEKVRECIQQLCALEILIGAVSSADALSHLTNTLRETIFQPEGNEGAVQVMGVLESAGVEVDHLFAIGLSDEVWPAPARCMPLLPVSLQRALDMPHSSAEWEADFARRMLDLWAAQSGTVLLSCGRMDAGLSQRPSPLILRIQAAEEAVDPERHGFAGAVLDSAIWESIAIGSARPLPDGAEVRGGVSILRNQAACPFKAFATHRLNARRIGGARLGPDARERGILLHAVMAAFYRHIDSQSALVNLPVEPLRELIAKSVDAGIAQLRAEGLNILMPGLEALERLRMNRLLEGLLEIERTRAPFRVVGCEVPRSIELGGLKIRGRIDRIDALEDGRLVVLDYKTGNGSVSAWFGPRPDEPQVPLYVLWASHEVWGAAFVQMQADEIIFAGIGQDDGFIPGVCTLDALHSPPADIDSWSTLMHAWRQTTEHLAAQFRSGDATVDPKRGNATCRTCDLGTLCRIAEQGSSREREQDDDNS